jgi:chemotaxis protein MotB
MDRQQGAAPVIVRRRRGLAAEGGHHGGAWKVAYADFVTAMMAFFLVMWLMNATTESQRRGLADYFSPSIPVNRISGGGDGAFGGRDIFSEESIANLGTGGTTELLAQASRFQGLARNDGGDAGGPPTIDSLAELEAMLQFLGGESMAAKQALRHVVTRLTDEGLIVEIFDLPGEPLFEDDTDIPMPVLRELAGLFGEVFALSAGGIAIEGHTRAYPVVLSENPVWSLSSARSQATRRVSDLLCMTDPFHASPKGSMNDHLEGNPGRIAEGRGAP